MHRATLFPPSSFPSFLPSFLPSSLTEMTSNLFPSQFYSKSINPKDQKLCLQCMFIKMKVKATCGQQHPCNLKKKTRFGSMNYLAVLILLLLKVQESCSFLAPVSLGGIDIGSNKKYPQTSNSFDDKKNNIARIQKFRAGAAITAGDASKQKDDSDSILSKAMLVGAVTAAMGFIYGKVLGASVRTVWQTLPAYVLRKVGRENFNPVYFITSICTAGGVIIGLLSAKFGTVFNVGDLVSSYSSTPPKRLPGLGGNLMPLLLMSLITSMMGFSVGPEAPLCAGGALVGTAISKYLETGDETVSAQNEEVLAYAGAAGALTAFMGIPLAGSIFALEVTRSDAGIASTKALSPSVLSSVSAIILMRAVLLPSVSIGGHFTYASIGNLSGLTTITTALATGLGGALIGTVFHKLVAMIKTIAWTSPSNTSLKGSENTWKKPVIVKGLIGLMVGIISCYYPQTLFWGEGSLQTVIDGHLTPFSETKHGLPQLLTSVANVNPSVPFQSATAAAQVGVAKLVAIALACAGKFPGGIIFPLMFAGKKILFEKGTCVLSRFLRFYPIILTLLK